MWRWAALVVPHLAGAADLAEEGAVGQAVVDVVFVEEGGRALKKLNEAGRGRFPLVCVCVGGCAKDGGMVCCVCCVWGQCCELEWRRRKGEGGRLLALE